MLALYAVAIVALRRRMHTRHAQILTALAAIVLSLWGSTATTTRADIVRWDNGQVIPGTEGITPGPGILLNSLDLRFANLAQLT
jgi:hypothetical protein